MNMSNLVGAFVISALFAPHAWADATTDAVIAKAIKAVGGEDKLKSMPASTWSEKGMYFGMGEGMPYTGKYAAQWPGKFKMEIEGVFTIVMDGDKAYMNGADLAGDELAEQKENHHAMLVASLLPLKDKEYQLSTLPETKVDNKPAVGVKVSRKGHRDVSLYFDKDSGLLVKSVARVKAQEQGGQEMDQVTYYQNYKDVDGLKSPMKFVIKREDKPYVEAEVMDLKRSAKLDEKTFAK